MTTKTKTTKTTKTNALPLRPIDRAAAPVADAPVVALDRTSAELDAMQAILDAPLPVADAPVADAPVADAPVADAPAPVDAMAALVAMVAQLAAQVQTLTAAAPVAAPAAPLAVAADYVAPVAPRNAAPRASEVSAADKPKVLASLERQLADAKAAKDTKAAKKLRGRMRDLGYYRSHEGAYGATVVKTEGD